MMKGLTKEAALKVECGYETSPGSFSCPEIEDSSGSISSTERFLCPKVEDDHPPPAEKKPKLEGVTEGGGYSGKEGGSPSEPFEIDEVITDYAEYEKVLEELKDSIILSPGPDQDYCMDGDYGLDWDTWKEYYKQIKESEGFEVDIYPACCPMAPLKPNKCFKKYPERCKELETMANLALDSFNAEHSKRFEFVELERVVEGACSGIMYYLTFKAKDPNEADVAVKTFQAKVYDGIREQSVELCRIKTQRHTGSAVLHWVVRQLELLNPLHHIDGNFTFEDQAYFLSLRNSHSQ